jgi:hypothetical protein
MSVRERAAAALDDDFPDVLEALRRGLKDKSAATAARAPQSRTCSSSTAVSSSSRRTNCPPIRSTSRR